MTLWPSHSILDKILSKNEMCRCKAIAWFILNRPQHILFALAWFFLFSNGAADSCSVLNITSFSELPLSVTDWLKPVEKCICQTWIWHGRIHILKLILLLNPQICEQARAWTKRFVHIPRLYMTPLFILAKNLISISSNPSSKRLFLSSCCQFFKLECIHVWAGACSM